MPAVPCRGSAIWQMAKTASSHKAWLNSYPKASKWAAQYDVQQLLDEGGGLAKISNFFPAEVAEGVLHDLEAIPQAAWNATAASRDHTHNNISHEFWSVRQAKGLDAVLRVVSLLLPDSLHSFSAAKYLRGHHIEAHDDRAYTQVRMDDGAVVSCSRDIACIVYLTRGWRDSYGGLLVDLEAAGGPRTFVPEFNSAILFRIPRWHAVTPMATDRPRFTLFGWFLVPGQLYDLQLRVAPEHGAGQPGSQQPPQQQQAVQAADGGPADDVEQQREVQEQHRVPLKKKVKRRPSALSQQSAAAVERIGPPAPVPKQSRQPRLHAHGAHVPSEQPVLPARKRVARQGGAPAPCLEASGPTPRPVAPSPHMQAAVMPAVCVATKAGKAGEAKVKGGGVNVSERAHAQGVHGHALQQSLAAAVPPTVSRARKAEKDVRRLAALSTAAHSTQAVAKRKKPKLG